MLRYLYYVKILIINIKYLLYNVLRLMLYEIVILLLDINYFKCFEHVRRFESSICTLV